MADDFPTSPKLDYQHNVEHARQSKLKGVLYGGDDRPITPVKIGKKQVAHSTGSTNGAAPFATQADLPLGVSASQQQQQQANPTPRGPRQAAANTSAAALTAPKTYVALKSKQQQVGAGKIGAREFDPEVYRDNIMENVANRQAQKSKAYHGAGNILSFNPGKPGEDEDEEHQQHGHHH